MTNHSIFSIYSSIRKRSLPRLLPYVILASFLLSTLQLGTTSTNMSFTKLKYTQSSQTESYSPNMSLDSQGNVHVVWYDYTDYAGAGTDADILYRFYNVTTKTWGTVQVVSTESTADSVHPRVAVDSQDNVHVVWYDLTDYLGAGTDYDIFYKMYSSTSKTWTTTQVISTETTSGAFYPNLAIDSHDNLYVAWIDLTDYTGAGTDADIFYKLYNVTTSTWTTTQVISTESTAQSYAPNMVVDNHDNVHLIWPDLTDYAGAGTDADVFYKLYNATTSTWGTIQVISTESLDSSGNAKIAVDSQGNVHIVWYDYSDYAGAGFDPDIFYKLYNTTTSTWTTTQIITSESTTDSYSPTLSIDSHDNIHLSWAEYSGTSPDYDIIYKVYNATTATWTATEVISTESTATANGPNLVVDNLDNIHIVWQDDTNYTNAGVDNDIFYKMLNITTGLWTTTEVVSTEQITIQTTTSSTRSSSTSSPSSSSTQTTSTTTSSSQNKIDTTPTMPDTSSEASGITLPWFIMPTIMALVVVEFVIYRKDRN